MKIEDIEEIVNVTYDNLRTDSKLKDDFEKVLINYLQFHQKEIDEESFFCQIHKNFNDGHNCVACNLNLTNERISNFLYSYKFFGDIYTTYSIFIMLLYLQVECFFEYMNIVKIPEPYLLKNFRTFYKIKRWANFLKHPKSFLLVHHPEWRYEDDAFGEINPEKVIINTEFVEKFYKGDKTNTELYRTLKKKEDLIVLFPNPEKLTEQYLLAQQSFKNLISENSIVREILEDEATIKEYFEEECENKKDCE